MAVYTELSNQIIKKRRKSIRDRQKARNLKMLKIAHFEEHQKYNSCKMEKKLVIFTIKNPFYLKYWRYII